MLIDGGNLTTAAYMSNTIPIPANKNDIAVCTAIAGEMLGLKLIYMDAGSGALNHIPCEMVREVKANISIPLFVGGGIRNAEDARLLCKAGADVIVIGTVTERNPGIIKEIKNTVNELN
jgi:putative glycerol-1-phosphate prenyltransferase